MPMQCTAAVVGAGRQGTCAAYDLARLEHVGAVVVVDYDEDRLAAAADLLDRLAPPAEIRFVPADATDRGALEAALRDVSAVVSAVPYVMGPGVCAAAIAAGAHAVDLGGNLEVSRTILDLGPRAAARGVAVAPDCGLMPGLGNVLAAWSIERLRSLGGDRIEVLIRCGGLPRSPRNELGYELVFSFEGLMNEYDGVSHVVRDGRRDVEPTLEDIAPWTHARLGALETATTSGGTSTAPESLADRVWSYRYRTVRYPGHFAFFRTLKRLGCLAPERRAALRALLEPALAVAEPDDLVLLRVDAMARDGRSVSKEVIDLRDAATGFTAMERMTAFPAVAVLELALEGRVAKGAVRIERDLPLDDYLGRLERRGILPTP